METIDTKEINIEQTSEKSDEKQDDSVLMHHHKDYEYFHPVSRVHANKSDIDQQELIVQFRQVINSHFHNSEMFAIKVVPRIRYAIIEKRQLLYSRNKIFELTKKLGEMGHEEIGDEIDKCLDNIVPDFVIYQDGQKIEIAAVSDESVIVAKAELDVDALKSIGFNDMYVTGIIENRHKD